MIHKGQASRDEPQSKDRASKSTNHIGHKGCQGVRVAKPVKKKLDWATKNNNVDCGVFLMRHMKTYMGSKVKKWRCGLVDDESKQEMQVNNLRLKYAYIILKSNVNIHKKRVVEVAKVLDVDAEFGYYWICFLVDW
ncbi:hypothetical protein QVD17_37744 [Tagetes erecta]|uniref:Ubiquitin-like protease family profile domain-containing protein n=1 Tax=Tagetes erecta TaxID=13708 RepID=A0AAD8NKA5_TARER|nr:hypothetical protein QVD17_37744 [Tagetes erecta]